MSSRNSVVFAAAMAAGLCLAFAAAAAEPGTDCIWQKPPGAGDAYPSPFCTKADGVWALRRIAPLDDATRAKAEAGDGPAMTMLAAYYVVPADQSQPDYATAFDWAAKAAKKDPEGKVLFSYLSIAMARVMPDKAKLYPLALELLGDAAAHDNVEAAYLLSHLAEPAARDGFLAQAAEEGFAPAQFDQAFTLELHSQPENDREVARLYQASAAQGFPAAMFRLGMQYQYGSSALPRDPVQAVRWYGAASQAGFAGAGTQLGDMYYKGDGVALDKTTAARWYLAASELGDFSAKLKLAKMYATGDGIPHDPDAAARIFNSASPGSLLGHLPSSMPIPPGPPPH